MPRPRESLNSAKTSLSRDLKNRTEKRVREILSPRTPESQEEIFDDSEEKNRLEKGRRLRRTKDKDTQTERCLHLFVAVLLLGYWLCCGC